MKLTPHVEGVTQQRLVAHGFLGIVVVAVLVSGCVQARPERSINPGTRDCGPLLAGQCHDSLVNVAGSRAGDIAGFQVVCTAASCSGAEGAIDVTILWVDGTSSTRSAAWASGPFDPSVLVAPGPIPTPPVSPTCLGTPRSECLGEWTTALENLPAAWRDEVVFVIVRCDGHCTPTDGAGETVVELQGGRRVQADTWSYHHTP